MSTARWVVATSVAVVLIVAGIAYSRYHHRSSALVQLPVTGATITWRPNMNRQAPDSTTHIDASQATELAQAINATPKLPSGPIACPADFGSKATVDFSRRHHADEQEVIRLSGCAGPGNHGMTQRLLSVLKTIAPAGALD